MISSAIRITTLVLDIQGSKETKITIREGGSQEVMGTYGYLFEGGTMEPFPVGIDARTDSGDIIDLDELESPIVSQVMNYVNGDLNQRRGSRGRMGAYASPSPSPYVDPQGSLRKLCFPITFRKMKVGTGDTHTFAEMVSVGLFGYDGLPMVAVIPVQSGTCSTIPTQQLSRTKASWIDVNAKRATT